MNLNEDLIRDLLDSVSTLISHLDDLDVHPLSLIGSEMERVEELMKEIEGA